MNNLQTTVIMNLLFWASFFFTIANFFWAAIFMPSFKDFSTMQTFMFEMDNWVLFVVGLVVTAYIQTVKSSPEEMQRVQKRLSFSRPQLPSVVSRQRKKKEQKKKPKNDDSLSLV